MKHTLITRFCAAALAFLFLFSFSACRGKKENAKAETEEEEAQGVDISESVYTLFDEAVAYYNRSDCRATAYSYAFLKDSSTGETSGSYLQTFERLIRRIDGKTEQNVSSYYAAALADPESAERGDLKHFYDCYIKDDLCYFDYSGDRKITRYENDYLSHIGLYSIALLNPETAKAIRTDRDIVITFTFSSTDCQNSQSLFIATMLIAFFGEEIDTGFSKLTFKAHLDPETHRIDSYKLTFQGIPMSDPSAKISFVYKETFYDFGTTDPLTVPDLTKYF